MNVNYRFTEAITWALIADLMRRHEATGLRVVEMHPSGGQADCRTIIRPTSDDYGPHTHFNRQSGTAHFHESFGPRREFVRPPWAGEDRHRLDYVEAVFQAEHRMQVVNYIEAMVGLPSSSKSPATTKHALTYRFMAEVAARSMLDGPIVRWENGREDTSGYGSADPVRPALRRVPEIACHLDERAVPSTPADRPGYRFWIWTTRKRPHETAETVAVVDALDAVLYHVDSKGESLDLYNVYDEAGRNVRRLVDVVERALP